MDVSPMTNGLTSSSIFQTGSLFFLLPLFLYPKMQLAFRSSLFFSDATMHARSEANIVNGSSQKDRLDYYDSYLLYWAFIQRKAKVSLLEKKTKGNNQAKKFPSK